MLEFLVGLKGTTVSTVGGHGRPGLDLVVGKGEI